MVQRDWDAVIRRMTGEETKQLAVLALAYLSPMGRIEAVKEAVPDSDELAELCAQLGPD